MQLGRSLIPSSQVFSCELVKLQASSTCSFHSVLFMSQISLVPLRSISRFINLSILLLKSAWIVRIFKMVTNLWSLTGIPIYQFELQNLFASLHQLSYRTFDCQTATGRTEHPGHRQGLSARSILRAAPCSVHTASVALVTCLEGI